MDEALKLELCDICHRLYDRGYVVANDGNVSARTDRNTVWITPSGVGKGRIAPDMLVETDLEGRVLSGDRFPSSEGKMHWMIYRQRPDVQAVVHAHPPISTAFAICRRPLKERYLAELVLGLGEVPVTDFAMLGTDEVPDSVQPFVADHSAVLLANHGALTWGPSLLTAFDRMEIVEQTAKIHLLVDQLGDGVEMTPEQAALLRSRTGFYEKLAGKRS